MHNILVVDDDADIREMLVDYLSPFGYQVSQAESATQLRAMLQACLPQVVLLDVSLPDEDGLSLARHIREHYDIGIIMVSGAGATVDRIIGLEVGADDYVSKPFDPRELLARVKSVIRRYPPLSSALSATATNTTDTQAWRPFGRCQVDLDGRRLLDGGGAEIPLTSMEFDLLRVFLERPNRVLSRDDLLGLTQNRDWDPFDRSIDIRVARLRKKIEATPDKPEFIKTVRGAGYRYQPPGGG
ncbi:response regulator [Litchfieldella rifensis]|uniref:Response regulator n=1 Tax=Litchfieldella rifensis TaxID=762643 RepID=A0ABV7LTH8_9GAMM